MTPIQQKAREIAQQVISRWSDQDGEEIIATALRTIGEETREECAKVCDIERAKYQKITDDLKRDSNYRSACGAVLEQSCETLARHIRALPLGKGG